MNLSAARPMHRRDNPAFGLLACLLAAALCFGVLAGCAAQPAAEETPSSSAEAEPVAQQEPVTLHVAVPAVLQGAVEELAGSYAADKDWLSLQVSAYASAKKENAAITPEAPEDGAREGEDAAAGNSGDADAADDPKADAAVPPVAEIVFQSSASAMDDAEELGAVDPKTRNDLLEDALCIVAGADSKIQAVSTADIEAGACPLAVCTGKGAAVKRQRQALEALGAWADGAPAGFYASDAARVVQAESTADLFKVLSADDSLVAIVRTSDVCRYGGVKAVGAIPARLHSPMRYPQALGANLDALENGEQVEQAARDFLNWVATDETALGIVEKWGLRYAS